VHPSARAEGLEKVVKSIEWIIFPTSSVALTNALLTASGVIESDLWHHVLAFLLDGCVMGGTLIARRLSLLSHQRCIALVLREILLFLFAVPTYVFLSPHSSESDLNTILLLNGPLFGFFMFIQMWLVVNHAVDAISPWKAFGVLLCTLSMMSSRCVWDHQSCWILFTLPPFGALMAGLVFAIDSVTKAMINAQEELRIEIARGELAREQLRNAKSDVEMERFAFSRILAALCDVVVNVRDDLSLVQPSLQLQSLLPMGAVSEPINNLRDLMLSTDEAVHLQEFLCSSVSNQEHSSNPTPAEALNVRIRDQSGTVYVVEIFHAHLSQHVDSGRHLLGMRLTQADSTVPTDVPDVPDDLESAVSFMSQCSDSDTNTETANVASDPSMIAIQFDAGRPACPLHGYNQVVRHALSFDGNVNLCSMMMPGMQEQFEQWVVDEVSAADSDRTTMSKTVLQDIVLHSPTNVAKSLQAAKAWLEIPPPSDDALPTVLWLASLMYCERDETVHSKVFKPRIGKLHAIPELPNFADNDAARSIVPDDSVSCGGFCGGFRLRRRGHRTR